MKYFLLLLAFCLAWPAFGQETHPIVGAERPDLYLPVLHQKNIGLVVNQTSRAFDQHLVDFLRANHVTIKKIFAPEHGFRGIEDAGRHIRDVTDPETGIPIISLYGGKNKPAGEDLLGIDLVVFDIQDVGVRFYTYISTLHLVMESCAENKVELIVLDRPNPNGDYIDGPVLDDSLRSFVGMDPLPIVYGLTIGELAMMINGEGWLKDSLKCDLKIVPVNHYDHSIQYSLPVKPSPNLPNDQSVRLYPSLCLFEGTIMSVGRGTEFPFQVVGYPDSAAGGFQFVPVSTKGASEPLFNGQTCFGKDYRNLNPVPRFTLTFLIDFYYRLGKSNSFFNDYFDKLAGNTELKNQILAGFTEQEIRVTWHNSLKAYKQRRKNYLLYPDAGQ